MCKIQWEGGKYVADYVDGLYSVKLLRLYNNEISHIEAQSFLNLSECTWLDLSRNKLSEIREGTFDGLNSLKGLILDRNRISYIEPGSFSHLPLEGLTLSYNRLITLHELVLPKSQSTSLSLANNPILCDNTTYWIKQAQKDGRIAWKYNDHKPNCENCPGVNWDDISLNCSVIGNLLWSGQEKNTCFLSLQVNMLQTTIILFRCNPQAHLKRTTQPTTFNGWNNATIHHKSTAISTHHL